MIILKNVILRRSAKVLLDGASVVLNPGEKVVVRGVERLTGDEAKVRLVE